MEQVAPENCSGRGFRGATVVQAQTQEDQVIFLRRPDSKSGRVRLVQPDNIRPKKIERKKTRGWRNPLVISTLHEWDGGRKTVLLFANASVG